MTAEDEFSPSALEIGRKLFAKNATFMLGVVNMNGLPDEGPPEVAFAGRSNVGKSSLLNALTNQNGLARASNTPGRTREINYFDLGNAMRLVDLPGYGYARVSRKDVEAWTRLTRDFLRGRSVLRRVCLLIDGRRGFKKNDNEVMDLLDESAVNYQLVLTKADKVKPSSMAVLQQEISDNIKRRPAAHPVVRVTSSTSGEGLEMLRADLATIVAP